MRKAKNMSLTQLAKLLQISPSTVGMYEQGRRMPDVQTIVQLVQLFDVSLDYLITGKEHPCKSLHTAGQYALIWQADGSILLQPVP